MTERMALIKRYQLIESRLRDSVKNHRPICSLMAGDLVVLAERLGYTESAYSLLHQLYDEQRMKSQPTGVFKGVTGAFT